MAQQRAQQLLNSNQGLHCCQFVAYCIYGDKSKNQGGANGWKDWGSAAQQNDARVIWQPGHVGFVAGNNVYYSSGKGGEHKKKSFADYVKYVVNGKEYKLRK